MHLSTEDFERLERLVSERDAAAFDTLRRAYQVLIHRFVSTKTTNPGLASDNTNAIFKTAWEKCDRYPYRISPSMSGCCASRIVSSRPTGLTLINPPGSTRS